MILQLRGPGLDLGALFRRHLEGRLRDAFGSSSRDVQGVTVSLADVNGPRGGTDLECAVTVDLAAGGQARGEARDSDAVVALGRAVARAKRSMRRGRQRRRTLDLQTAARRRAERERA